jgi:hypothetical protein
MSEEFKAPPRQLDGFETFEDATEGGDDQQPTNQVIKGKLLKFTSEMWVTREGEEISADLELVAVDVRRIVQKWKDQVPVEILVLEPGQKFPDLEKLNAEMPRQDWIEGHDGKLRGPWQAQYVVYLLNPATMDQFSFATGTIGGRICVCDLVKRTQWMRKLSGDNVYPVVTLSDTFMKTKHGGRQRPHFLIKRWILQTLAPASAATRAPPST